MGRFLTKALTAALLCLGLTAPAPAQTLAPGEPGAAARALIKLPARLDMALRVSSPSFTAGGTMPEKTTQYGQDAFPGLAWSPPPRGAKSVVLIMQDTNVILHDEPLFHCLAFNIPGRSRGLLAGMLAPPAPGRYGANYKGEAAYAGPRPPPGFVHHYHFQLFALDAVLPANAAATPDRLIAAMNGHVLVSGEIVGLSQAP